MTEKWRCESLRLSALWDAPSDNARALTWEAVVGSQPDQREDQPKLGSFREHGTIAEGSLALDVRTTLGRVDWLMAPLLPPVEPTSIWLRMPLVSEVLSHFGTLLFDKAGHAYDAPRLAFGVAAVSPVPSVGAAYELLGQLIPDLRVPKSGASELIFQINRPRQSVSMPSIKLNRLSRWMSVAANQVIGVLGSAPQVLANTQHAVRVELDLSTPAEFTHRHAFTSVDRAYLFAEMSDLAREILEKGDIP